MPLVPAHDDPNRDKELERAAKDPASFDPDPISNRPPNTNSNSGGLVEAKTEPGSDEAIEEDEGVERRRQMADYLASSSVSDVTEGLDEISSVEELQELLEVESANKNRTTLIAAILEEIENRGD